MRRPHQLGIAPSERLRFGELKKFAPRLLGLARPHWRALTIGFAALALGSGINLLFPYLLRRLLNGELGFSLSSDLGAVTLGLIGLFAIQAGVFFVRHKTFAATGYEVVSDLRKQLFDRTVNQDIEFFDTARVGDLLSRLSSDTQLVQNAVTINISVALRYLLQILGGIALMLTISWKLTALILLLVPVTMFAGKYWGSRLSQISRKMQEELGEAGVVAEESLTAIRTVRVFAGSAYESERYAKRILSSLGAGRLRAHTAAAFSSTMVFLMHSSIAVVFFAGGRLVLGGSLSVGDLSAFILYCVIVAVSFGFIISAFDEFMQAVGASARIFELLDHPVKIVSPGVPTRPNMEDQVHLEFRNVTFAYPSRPSSPVLEDISFALPVGKTLALVGPSGSGKSTIAALIPRYYDPTSGEILFRGVALPKLDLAELRKEISVVAQDCQVFSLSIEENIRYGRPDATDQQVRDAATAASLSEFIEALPSGYGTLVGDRGVQLSGGQRQRLAIARAILKDPKFLILDEATSALDSENEQLVQKALSELMKNRTTLIIAHRLSTIQHAHTVLVLRDGKIIQRGTHESLIEENGLYRSLVQLQMLAS